MYPALRPAIERLPIRNVVCVEPALHIVVIAEPVAQERQQFGVVAVAGGGCGIAEQRQQLRLVFRCDVQQECDLVPEMFLCLRAVVVQFDDHAAVCPGLQKRRRSGQPAAHRDPL